MAHDVLPVCRAGLLTSLHIELGDEAVRRVERDQLLLQRSELSEFFWVSMLAADMHGATHARLRNSMPVESRSAGGADRHNGLAISLWKASLTRQKTRHGWLNLDRDRPFPVDVVEVSWLLLHVAHRACCYLHRAFVVEGFQKRLHGVDFTFCRNGVAPITSN